MNRTLKRIWACALAVCTIGFSVLASACNEKPISAYEIAVQYGFQGTEAEWLASLKGAKGEDGQSLDIWEMYQTALNENAFTGTFIQFLQQLGFSFSLQEDNDTVTLAKNTSSVVSICCGFRKTERRVVSGALGPTYKDVEKPSGALGSGVIWSLEDNGTSSSAYIVTNYHVVYATSAYTDEEDGISKDIWVYPYGARVGFTTGDANKNEYLDGSEQMGDFQGDGIRATYVGGAIEYDIAVLKIENSSYLKQAQVSAVELGSSHQAKLGEKVYVIGNPAGRGLSVTGGMVSSLSETITMNAIDGTNQSVSFRVMRTDAPINAGNSGGAMFDGKGKLIGIPNAKTTATNVDDMGYALPIDQVKAVVDNVLYHATPNKTGYVALGTLGIVTTLQSAYSYLDNDGNIRIKEEFRITEVREGLASASKEENKCFKYGDVIISGTLNGNTIEFTRRYLFQEQLLEVRLGETITYKVNRDGREMDVQMTFDKEEYFKIYN